MLNLSPPNDGFVPAHAIAEDLFPSAGKPQPEGNGGADKTLHPIDSPQYRILSASSVSNLNEAAHRYEKREPLNLRS
jgi:hypothetical protein